MAVLLTIGVACLGGCGAFLNNNSDASASLSGRTAFAPTSTEGHAAAVAEADKLTAAAKPGNSFYKIGPLDVLDVSVFKVPDLSRTVLVADDGTINFPLVGQLPAAGRTAHELERDLTEKLGEKYLRSPQVTVLVREYNSQRVTIEGSVKTTGVYTIKGKTTLMQAMAMAGDIDESVASGDVVIFRTIDGKRSAARFDFESIKAGKAEDPELQPGDVIMVDTSGTKVALQNVLKVLPLATSAAIFVPLM